MFWNEWRQRLLDLGRDAETRSLAQRTGWAFVLLAIAGFAAVRGRVPTDQWLGYLLLVAVLLSILLLQPLRRSRGRPWVTAAGAGAGIAVAVAITMETGGVRSINLPVDIVAVTVGGVLLPEPLPVLIAIADAVALALTTAHTGAGFPWRLAVTGTAALLAGARCSAFGYRALAEGERNLRIQKAAYRVSASLTTLDLDRILPELAQTVGHLAGANVAMVLAPGGDGTEAQVHTWHAPDHPPDMAVQALGLRDAAERAMRERVRLFRAVRGGWRVLPSASRPRPWPLAVAVPMLEEGVARGAVVLAGSRARPLPVWAPEAVTALAAQAALGMRAAREHATTLQAAMIDPITHLPNARFLGMRLEEEVARARRLRTPVSLLFLDSDSLKTTNDAFGHAFGDRLVVGIAQMLVAQIRQYDIAVRYYGGDEFLVILPDTDWPEAVDVAQRLLRAARLVPVGPHGRQQGSVSIGIATFPAHAATAPDLIARADDAMYQAKQAGKDQLAVFGVRTPTTRADGRPFASR